MRNMSPLSRALTLRPREFGGQRVTPAAEETAWLDAIERLLEGGPVGKGRPATDRLPRAEWLGPVARNEQHAARVEALYPRLVAAPLNGAWPAEALLLELATRRPSPSTIPLFEAALAVSRPRDPKAPERRAMAVAGLALLAILGIAPGEAVAALAGWAARCRPRDLLDAVEALAVVAHSGPTGSVLARPALAAAAGAKAKGTLAARFLARYALAALGEGPSAGAVERIDLDVRLRSAPKVVRTIRLSGTHSLGQLHHAIQAAFGWDSDHLYEFCLEPDGREPRVTIDGGLPDGSEPEDSEGIACASKVLLRELALRPGECFAYLFDFGDHHRFSVEVAAVAPEGGRKAPEVIRAVGKAPAQYRW